MIHFILRRLLLLLVTLFGITMLTFLLTRLTPGDPAQMRLGSGQGSTTAGAYEQLIELNRRNLGLDRPWVLNLREKGTRGAAHRAIDDLFRATPFWKSEAERRLLLIGPPSIPVVLERARQIGVPGEPLPRDSRGVTIPDLAANVERTTRLLTLLPRLLDVPSTATLGMETTAALAFFDRELKTNSDRLDATAARDAVRVFLSSTESTRASALAELRRRSGLAIPQLMHALHDPKSVPLAANALETLTGLTLTSTDPRQTRARWESWYRRESVYLLPASPVAFLTDTQFGLWVSQALRFDFGESYVLRRPVSEMIREALPISVLLSALSIFISYLVAIPIGIYSAVRRYSPADRTLTVILFILYSLPSFWVAGLFILTLTGPPLSLFPTRGLNSPGMSLADNWSNLAPWLLDRLWHLVLPVLCLTYGSLAFISRQMRSALLETLGQDYIRTATAKGLGPWQVILRHGVRNSLLPLITISAGLLPELIAGAVIIESIFTLPGMGSLTFTAILNRDYPVINAVLFLSALLSLLGLLIADVCYSIADPRIEYR